MVHIHGEIVINRPLEEVFDVVADTSREPRYNPRMHHAEQITNGPIGVGTRFHAETSNASADCSAGCRRFVEVIVGNESRGVAGAGSKTTPPSSLPGRATAGHSVGFTVGSRARSGAAGRWRHRS